MRESLAAALAAYIPRDRAAQIVAGAPLAREGAALVADISGFTQLAEALARTLSPARGAEELSRTLDVTFAPLIAAAHAYGGSVVKFGGDALIVWFPRAPRSPRAAVLRRALAAAHAMQAELSGPGAGATAPGGGLTMKVGVAYGPVARLRLGDAIHGYEDVIGGTTMDRMAQAEHRAGPGEVLLDPAGLAELAEVAPVLASRDGFALVGPPFRRPRRAPLPAPAPGPEHLPGLRPYVPAELAEALAAGRAQPAELKPVVSIFVQFAGVRYEDGAAAEGQLAAYFGAAQRTAARYGGRVNRLITGDKGNVLHLIFGAPRALEELEVRAARCALELRVVAGSLPFIAAQRVGMAAGRAFAGPVGSAERHDYTLIGDAINLSARLMQRAAPGQILLDAGFAERLGPAFALEPLGPAELKGRSAPVALFALAGEASAPRRTPEERVFGRDDELDELRGLLAGLTRGRGRAAVLIGELGSGKSHLLAALRHLPPAGPDAPALRWVAAAATAYGGRPGGALIARAIRGLLGLDPAAGYPELEVACAELLGPQPGAAAAPFIARLLGLPLDARRADELAALSGESLRWRLRELVGELAGAAAARGPVVLAVDDLQWADATSLDLIEAILPLTGRLPLLLLLAARPEPDARAWPILRRLHAAGAPWVELAPLTPAAAADLLRHHAPALPPAALGRLSERGGGNPLFLVELARAASAAGLDAELPDSIHGLLLAQIDRLPGALRDTLQRAALLGRVPDARLLAELDGDPGLGARLSALAAAGFLLRDGDGYGFRHILIQESAYGALLYERRRAGHRRAAAAIERLYPTEIAERSAELARHYERAGQALLAARYHSQAADAARLLYADEEAAAGYRHVLSLLAEGPAEEELRGRVLLKLAQVQMNVGDYGAAQELYDRAFATLERAAFPAGPRRARLLRVAIVEPETLDPGMVGTSAALELAHNLFEGLVSLDADLGVQPAAAVRWRVEEGGRRYRFTLRPGLRWSDGAPLTAHDFVFAWRRNLRPETASPLAALLHPISGAAAYSQGVETELGVSAPDDLTLDVCLAEPVGYLLQLLTSPVAMPQPAHLVASAGAAWAEPAGLVCNGAYTIEAWRAGREARLRRNEQYHGGNAAPVERALCRFIVPRDEWGRRDQLDLVRIADHRPPPAAGDEPLTLQYLATYVLVFACGQPQTAEPAVRRALALALDREALVRAVWGEVQQPAFGGIIPPALPGHSPGLAIGHDPVAARALLRAAGVAPELRIGATFGFGGMTELIAAAWRGQLGLRVSAEEDVPVEALLAGLGSGTFQAALIGWEAEYPDPDNVLRAFFHSASPLNCTGWRSGAFDDMIDRAATEAGRDRRLGLYRAAERLLVQTDVVAVPLYYERMYALLRPGFQLRDGRRLVRGGRLRLQEIAPAPRRRRGAGTTRDA